MMKTTILTALAVLTVLGSLTAAQAQSARDRDRDRDRSPYERGYYGDFDFDSDRWGRDLRFNDEMPSFFPDGRRVVFASNRDGRDRELYIRDTERGGRLIRLTDNRSDDWAPAVSPDGRWIAFLSDRDGRGGLFVMRSDGRDVKCLIPGRRTSVSAPTWSPDGRWLAFSARQGGGSALLRVRADGNGRVERLGGGND